MTVKTKLKPDDWFKSYGPMKYLLGSPLGAAILHILPSTLRPNQLVVPVWIYMIFNSSCIIFSILPHHASNYLKEQLKIICSHDITQSSNRN